MQIGDTVRVHVKVKEGSRERIQVFEGTVIAKKHGGIEETITVRRLSYGVGVEKVFPVHSPSIDHIEVVRNGKVRRAKLYYLRSRVGQQRQAEGEAVISREVRERHLPLSYFLPPAGMMARDLPASCGGKGPCFRSGHGKMRGLRRSFP